jgi:hypothetical protein
MNSSASATGTIDFRTMPDCVPSLCIPRVYPNISEARIRKIFDELGMGLIERVDIISKTTEKGERFNRVFIHMERWFQNSNASVARERLLGGKDIKIVYDDPWFWKVSAFRSEGNHKNNRNKDKVPPASRDNTTRRDDGRRDDGRRDDGFKKVKKEDIQVREERPVRPQRIEEPKIEVPPTVQYDPAVLASTKKRVIIKKETTTSTSSTFEK